MNDLQNEFILLSLLLKPGQRSDVRLLRNGQVHCLKSVKMSSLSSTLLHLSASFSNVFVVLTGCFSLARV